MVVGDPGAPGTFGPWGAVVRLCEPQVEMLLREADLTGVTKKQDEVINAQKCQALTLTPSFSN